ncbi:MAG TPA: phosphoenolpyruvate--protein phosphotransferase [Syntrophales bacterium]|nr:phosphoenolpyruvate--protein phosphotransferase [Syntrophales bacterium]
MNMHTFKERGISIIEDVGRIIADSSGPVQTLREIVRLVAEKFCVDVCSIYVFDEDKKCLSLVATYGLSEEMVGKIKMRLNEGLTGLVIEGMRPVFVKNPARHPRFKYFEGSGEERYHSFLGLPLIYHGEALGVLVIQTVDESAIGESDISVFSMISSQIAGEAAYANLLRDMKKMPEKTDETVGLSLDSQRETFSKAAKKELLKGIPVSAGFGDGHAHYFREPIGFSDVYFHEADDVDHEISRFENALKRSETQIERLCNDLKSELSSGDEDILHTYLMYIHDSGLKNKVIDYIKQRFAAEYALKEVISDYVRVFSRIEDHYLRERGFDIENVGRRILKNLLGLEEDDTRRFAKKTILIASSISPGELILLRQENLKGIILSKGGETSHVAILARSFEIPMVITSRVMFREIKEDDLLIIDGTSGLIFHNPPEVIVREYQRLENEKSQQIGRLEGLRQLKPRTRDGFEVKLGANIGLLSDLELVDKYGADHIGLYRTEFPFLVRERFPSEDEQMDLYRRILEAAKGKEVTIRTLDVGGDKFLSYVDYPREDNPYLGWRSIRVSLELRDVFREQIRAILKASAFGSLRILFPMISSVREIKDILSILNEEKERLRERHNPFDDKIKVGILLEVPAAVVILEKLLRYVDFVSVGTNDLVQFVLAVDRNNQKVAPIYNPLHPAVITTISDIASICKRNEKPMVICGEAAANPKCAYLYLGMGINQLSMNAPSVPIIKHLIRNVRQAQSREVLKRVQLMDDADEIDDFVHNIISPLLKGVTDE